MEPIFLEYPKCTTCQKAKKWLQTHNIPFLDRNITQETPSVEELAKWIHASGYDSKKFFNTSGLIYKDLHLKEKLPSLSEEERIKLLASNGMLIKRPLLVKGKLVLVGFKETEWEEKLK